MKKLLVQGCGVAPYSFKISSAKTEKLQELYEPFDNTLPLPFEETIVRITFVL